MKHNKFDTICAIIGMLVMLWFFLSFADAVISKNGFAFWNFFNIFLNEKG